MPQANDAVITGVFPRNTGGTVADFTPNIAGGSFQIVVECESGGVLALSGASYQLSIQAFDLTAGNNPDGPFSLSVLGLFVPPQWPQCEQVFDIVLTPAQVATYANHVMRYTATLVSPNPAVSSIPSVVSFAESDLFMLVR